MAQIPNNGWEMWTQEPQPVFWTTNSYPLTLPPWDPYIVRQDADAHTGDWCADFHGNGVMKPFATQTFPLSTAHPLQLEFWYKLSFPPCVNDPGYPEQDTVSVEVELMFNGSVVDQGHWESTSSVQEYTPVSIPISQQALQFDSCRITVRGGRVFGGCGTVIAPTEFRVDDINLVLPALSCVDPGQVDPGVFCPTVIEPVCGCNNMTYNNACEAFYSGGVTAWTAGACSGCAAAFSYAQQTASFTFTDQSTVVSPSYSWDFGDGSTSTDPNPSHTYAQPGWYNVCLVVTGLNGGNLTCSDISCQMVYSNDGCIDSSLICIPGSLCCDAPINDPVCGCDGVEYPNPCTATFWGGVMQSTPGSCVPNGVSTSVGLTVSVRPNPSNGPLLLTISGTTGRSLIAMRDAMGRTVLTTATGQTWIDLDLSGHGKGMYLLQVTGDDGRSYTQRVVLMD
jgi:PKD repeat protein